MPTEWPGTFSLWCLQQSPADAHHSAFNPPNLLGQNGHELAVVPNQSQELPQIFFRLETWAGCDGYCFLHLWAHMPTSQVVPEIMYLPPSNYTILQIGCELRLLQGLQDRCHL